jgi:hypothetical protein
MQYVTLSTYLAKDIPPEYVGTDTTVLYTISCPQFAELGLQNWWNTTTGFQKRRKEKKALTFRLWDCISGKISGRNQILNLFSTLALSLHRKIRSGRPHRQQELSLSWRAVSNGALPHWSLWRAS